MSFHSKKTLSLSLEGSGEFEESKRIFFFFFLSKVRLENFVQLGTISLNFISEGGGKDWDEIESVFAFLEYLKTPNSWPN